MANTAIHQPRTYRRWGAREAYRITIVGCGTWIFANLLLFTGAIWTASYPGLVDFTNQLLVFYTPPDYLVGSSSN